MLVRRVLRIERGQLHQRSCSAHNSRRPVVGAGFAVAILMCCLNVALAHADPCQVDTIGINWTLANNTSTPLLGEQPGQTFTAPESLMTFLRVWRFVGDDSTIIGMRLCITDTTQSGAPDLSNILYCGPTIVHFLSDHIHPTEFRWDLDPPLVLPHRGKFAFFILQDPCIAFWNLLASGLPPLYEGGNMWYTPRSQCILFPGLQPNLKNYPQYDLVFQAGFCRDVTTSIRRTSWGQLKRRYR